jgi:hypothetical protein
MPVPSFVANGNSRKCPERGVLQLGDLITAATQDRVLFRRRTRGMKIFVALVGSLLDTSVKRLPMCVPVGV